MIRKHSMLALVLAGILCVGSLIGCGGKQEEGAEQVSSESASAEQTNGENAPAEGGEGDPEAASGEEKPAKTKEEMLEMVPVSVIDDADALTLRKTYFGKRFDAQSMSWPELYVECYEGLYTSVQQNGYTYYKTAGAENCEVSADGLTVTFYLRRDAKWSDGVAVTAGDYEYAWKYLLDPANKLDASLLMNVQGAAAFHDGSGSVEDVEIHGLDAFTLQVKLKTPDPEFSRKTVSPALFPVRQSVVDAINESGESDWGEDWQDMVFNGPYRIVDYDKAHYVTLARNDYYWDQWDVTAEKVVWYLEVNDEMALKLFAEDHLDAIQLYTADHAALDVKVEAGELETLSINLPGLSYLTFRFEGGSSGVMKVGKLRQALSLALDREALAEQSGGIPAYGLVPTPYNAGSTAFRLQADEPLLASYDKGDAAPDKLKALIKAGLKEKKAAIREPEEIHLTLLTYETDEQVLAILNAIAERWQEVLGVTCEILVPETYKDFKELRDNGSYDVLYTSYSQAYDNLNDYMSSYIAGKNPNNGNSANDTYKKLVEEVRSNPAAAAEKYAAAEKNLIVENAYVVPLWYPVETMYVKTSVEKLSGNPFGANPEAAFAVYSKGNAEPAEESAEAESEESENEESGKKKSFRLFNGWGN